MEIRTYSPQESQQIASLFRSAFADAEGEAEGESIDMMSTTESNDLYGFVAAVGGALVGAIFFTRMRFDTNMSVFILSPVAVRPDQQGTGIGSALIKHGLDELREAGVDYAITYGDPDYYSRVGFHPISRDKIAPPLTLSQPEGWLGQSLSGEHIESIPGRSTCVTALDNPAYW